MEIGKILATMRKYRLIKKGDKMEKEFTRKENTIYVLSSSYGKDSLACLGAIEELGLPLDLIIHADVWATNNIPADLPPMVEFKEYADKKIKEMYGVDTLHICAIEKNGDMLTYEKMFKKKQKPKNTESIYTVSKKETVLGALIDLNKKPLKKITYESLLYRKYKDKNKIWGFPISVGGGGNWCTSQLKTKVFSFILARKRRAI